MVERGLGRRTTSQQTFLDDNLELFGLTSDWTLAAPKASTWRDMSGNGSEDPVSKAIDRGQHSPCTQGSEGEHDKSPG